MIEIQRDLTQDEPISETLLSGVEFIENISELLIPVDEESDQLVNSVLNKHYASKKIEPF